MDSIDKVKATEGQMIPEKHVKCLIDAFNAATTPNTQTLPSQLLPLGVHQSSINQQVPSRIIESSSNLSLEITKLFNIISTPAKELLVKPSAENKYIWKLKTADQWIPFEDEFNNAIERAFCNPSNDTFIQQREGRKFCINFETTPMTSDLGEIQRLSTRSYVKDRESKSATHWLWYYNSSNSGICWTLYNEDGIPPYQDVLEAKFQHSNRICCFEIEHYQYDLDFLHMTQFNTTTGKVRAVRRRPWNPEKLCVQFNTTTGRVRAVRRRQRNPEDVVLQGIDVPNRVFHFDERKLPKDVYWSPMDTESTLGTEAVPLTPCSSQYCEAEDMFRLTLPEPLYHINRIYRIQNINLWNAFELKQKNIEPHLKQHDLPWRSLFHGTGNFEVVRNICALGFDQRMHGVNGTQFGKGAYFATSAKYSHAYTKPTPDLNSLRYMFLARVLIGCCTSGKSDFQRPPPIDPMQPKCGLYDTCVDNMEDPSIFVVFDNNQSYPEYLIEYYDPVERSNFSLDFQRVAYAISQPPPLLPPLPGKSGGSRVGGILSNLSPPPPPPTTASKGCVIM